MPIRSRCRSRVRQGQTQQEANWIHVEFTRDPPLIVPHMRWETGLLQPTRRRPARIVQRQDSQRSSKVPRELCRAVLRGITAQLRKDGRIVNGCYGIQVREVPASGATDEEDKMAEQQLFGPGQGYSGKYKDDLTQQPLRDDLVKAASAKELAASYTQLTPPTRQAA